VNTDKIWEVLISITIALAGGLARLLNGKDAQKFRKRQIVAELFISGFIGLMALKLSRVFGLTGDWIGLVCGIAGWTGPLFLERIMKPVGKVIGIETEDKNEQ